MRKDRVTYNGLVVWWGELPSSASSLGSSKDLAGDRVVGSIVSILEVLVLQLSLQGHLVSVGTFSSTRAVSLDKE